MAAALGIAAGCVVHALAAAFGLAAIDPTFRTRTVNAPSAHGATLVCASGTFKVRSAQPDGTGWSVLTLEAP